MNVVPKSVPASSNSLKKKQVVVQKIHRSVKSRIQSKIINSLQAKKLIHEWMSSHDASGNNVNSFFEILQANNFSDMR